MSTKELREKAAKAIEGLSDDALVKLIEMLDELHIASSAKNNEAIIERIINEKRDLLRRLAQ